MTDRVRSNDEYQHCMRACASFWLDYSVYVLHRVLHERGSLRPVCQRVLCGVHLGQGVEAAHVPVAQQIAGVAVERAVRLGGRKQREHRLAHRLERPSRTPRRLEDVQAHLARLRATRMNGWVRQRRVRQALHAHRPIAALVCVVADGMGWGALTLKWMFGWKIFVTKRTLGGPKG